MVDEVRQIEGKVLEISRLQEIFTENVLKQVRAPFCIDDLFLISNDPYQLGQYFVGGV